MTKIITLDPRLKRRLTSIMDLIGPEKGTSPVTSINTSVPPPTDIQMVLNFKTTLATWADYAARNIGEDEVIIQLELLARMLRMRRENGSS